MTFNAGQRALGLHCVFQPARVLPQIAWWLDPNPAIRDEEVHISVQRLNLDAASFRQLTEEHDGNIPGRDAPAENTERNIMSP